ncbi:MAG TPA: 3-hydroxybutyrate dehydrogenase [Thermodesulfobacteriota bacterium]|nr:3-hydroxybutyrate dehydrogenase [Thermodesulfobacteriota bacterium]
MRLDGKIGIVTGAASGIGLAISEAFAKEGADVTIADLDEEGGKRAVERVKQLGRDAIFVKTNIANGEDCKRLIDETARRFGRIDILVNNAGLQYVSPITDFPEDKWDLLIGVMLTGTFLCTKYALPYMIRQKSGRIINMSSIHGLIGAKFKSAYVSAKHGVIGLTKVTALEMLEHGITANAICPTFVRTPLVDKQIDAQAKAHGIPREEVLEKVILAEAPMKRMLEPEEVAELAVYLASDLARNITGAAIPIDEGWTAQ